MSKDNIDKLDEQIKSILETEKKVQNKNVDEKEVIIDKKYAYDDIGEGDTKKIDKIEEIPTEPVEEIEEVKEEVPKVDEPVKEDPPVSKEPKKNSNLILFIVLGVLLVIILIILLIVFIPKGNKSTNDKDDKLSKNEQKEIIAEYGDALKGIISVYYEKQNVLLEYDDAVKLVNSDYEVSCSEHEIYEDGSIYLNKCSINDTKTSYSYGKKQDKKEDPIISEDAIKVYVSKSSGKATLKEPSKVEDYDIYSFEIDGAYSDLSLLSESSDYIFYMDDNYNVHMLNFKTGKRVLDSLNYTSILPIKVNGLYDTKYVAIQINKKWGIYNLKNSERVVQHKYDSVSPLLSMGVSGPATEVKALDDGVIAVVNYGEGENSFPSYGVINYHTGADIIKQEYKQMLTSGNYLWTVDYYGDGHIFDYTGKEYLDGNFDKLYWIVDGKYILVNDKDNIKVVSIKGKDLYNFGKLKVGDINFGLTYNDGALFQLDNLEKEEGNYESDCIELIYDASTKTGQTKTTYCGGIAKPVLYLYPKKDQKVTITFEHPELLQTTYPKYNGKWEVYAHRNGDLFDMDSNYYYALYWDEAKVHSVDFSTGYYVTKDNAISFLEKKLDYIGLNRREANEFIMYWLPVLEKNEKSLVYFELTEERESYNKLNISPKPDSLLRLVIHIKKVDKEVEIPKQNLTKLQRKGFVAVEWGGTTY